MKSIMSQERYQVWPMQAPSKSGRRMTVNIEDGALDITWEDVDVGQFVSHHPLALLGLGVGQSARVHTISQREGNDADEDGHGEGVGDGDPQISVDVEQNHPNKSLAATEPTIGLVQVLKEEV